MSRSLSPEDRRELGRLTKILTQKVVQVVVQSRLGEKAHTRSKSPVQGSDWFNLGIEDIGEIQQETKKGLGGHLPEKGKPLVVEIMLRTPTLDSLVLELWTLTVLDACDTSPARINPTIYNRMTVLLKSLLSVTRITPAYKLAFRQGPDSFIICYRVYLGDPDYECLDLRREPRCMSALHHLSSRPPVNPTLQNQQQQPERKISVAFVDAKPPKPDDFFLPDIPFSNLLTSTVEVQGKGEREAAAPQTQEKGAGGVATVEGGEKVAMTGSDGSHKSTASAQLKEEADFVMVELKTPFAGMQDAGNDLGTFYRECQNAPQLRMFADTPEDEISDLTEQLLTFEGYVDDYNELVRSLHSEESPGSSQ
ncbi:Autophagy-related protein 13 [Portunus trituberculatus]|uniref:Autophagy-related protein 13 n=1 Tax=Portunus trituberculatus TaxID=210409 RepID=A0A5B7D0H8_PORTR|nr:Autophagy-related protein 13 [Portunus trituberculatus]